MKTIRANWYEYPQYYDIAFGWDPSIETDFLEAAFERFADEPIRRVYEPFCGTGRIAIELARRGYDVIAADLLPVSIDFARGRARAAGVELDLRVADACDFTPAPPVDAVVTLIDSFRLIATADDALAAVDRFHAALRPGGVLVIGVDVGEKPIEITEEEQWTLERDGTVVETAVFDLRRPGETPGTSIARSRLHITEPDGRELEIITDDEMRCYSLASFRDLFEAEGRFQLRTVCNRKYDLDAPIDASSDYAGDIVAVFTRRR